MQHAFGAEQVADEHVDVEPVHTPLTQVWPVAQAVQLVVPQWFASVCDEHVPSAQQVDAVPHDVALHVVLVVVQTPLTQV
ncbi:MAG: hypothetical protein ACHREM_06195 [Polyangiales bacterium]